LLRAASERLVQARDASPAGCATATLDRVRAFGATLALFAFAAFALRDPAHVTPLASGCLVSSGLTAWCAVARQCELRSGSRP
jgi:hypothetical protein